MAADFFNLLDVSHLAALSAPFQTLPDNLIDTQTINSDIPRALCQACPGYRSTARHNNVKRYKHKLHSQQNAYIEKCFLNRNQTQSD